MLLSALIKNLNPISIKGCTDIEIKSIAYDSRRAEKDSLFVCIEGTVVDGHKFIADAIVKGAKALLVQKDVEVPDGVTVIQVDNTRYALACVSAAFYGHPSNKFKLIGITGTKGKTTTTYMIKSILEAGNHKVGLVGTIANYIGNEMLHTERTTPESLDLQSLFSEMVAKNVDSVVMEVSSQGLALNRVSCCNFDIGVFTNLSRDHIGPREHKDIDDYLNAKIKLFKMCKRGLVNIDSEYAKRVIEEAECDTLTYGIEQDADIRAENIKKNPDSVEFDVKTPWMAGSLKVGIPGKFTVYNALAAVGVCGMLGASFESIKSGLEKVSVPGRVEVVDIGKNYTVIIDYAHTPDSLENVLTTIKGFTDNRLICLFGCGGDRDRTKRSIMGRISGQIADFTIITSDNPRSEEPAAIIKEIEEGIKMTNGKYITIVDRREAIKYALQNAQAGDVIVLAGKGHETYQTFKDKTIHFDEREVVREVLKELEGNSL
ncbi:MAG TPA: UDP-N-acetylmuramoyl-L-alanyl-D-glutamate--2,6-diaminopimelate ligase [Clostridiaceae bacterium]|nr:UDP-N-acetylmuramoyl-L-alanyl-D-glutamate--2,6-diaminopimelate ligase [Clostridiaceae bacterium]